MKMESNARRASGALKMAPTGERKKVDEDRTDRLAELVKKHFKPAHPSARSAFDVVAMLAPLDAERLKLIADVFVAMRPLAPMRSEIELGSTEGSTEALHEIERSMGTLTPRYECAKEHLILAEIKARREEGTKAGCYVTPRYLRAWREIILAELAVLRRPAAGSRKKATAPRRRRPRKGSNKPSNVVPFERRPPKEIESPKSSS